MTHLAQRAYRRFHTLLTKHAPRIVYPNIEDEFHEIWLNCRSYTMTSIERAYGLYQAVNYVCANDISGDFVECGVWRGGSSMIAAHTFMRRNVLRHLLLYDTFSGMSMPTDHDVSLTSGKAAMATWEKNEKDGKNLWCYASLDDVRRNISDTGYPSSHLHMIPGKVEETLVTNKPENISILRLDTDFYRSTKSELEFLYPRLVRGGVLIVDDYGQWGGSKSATDEYFKKQGMRPLFGTLDYTGRIAVKAS